MFAIDPNIKLSPFSNDATDLLHRRFFQNVLNEILIDRLTGLADRVPDYLLKQTDPNVENRAIDESINFFKRGLNNFLN